MNTQQYQEIKTLLESLKKNDSSTDEIQELTKQKLKQETHNTRWVVPLIQSITPLCALFITCLISFNTNLLDNKSVLNQVTEKNNNISKSEANLQLENKKRELLIETYDLSKTRDTLGFKNKLLSKNNDRLKASSEGLIKANEAFRFKIESSQYLVNSLQNQKQIIGLKLTEAVKGFDSIKEERQYFGQVDNNLFIIKRYPQRENPAVDNIIKALQTKNKYSQRIIDSLEAYEKQKIPYLPALCSYILYFGSRKDDAKERIMDHLRHRFDPSKKSPMNYEEILTSYRWSSSDRQLFTQILFSLLRPECSLRERVLILNQIANFQKYFYDYQLDRIDFNLFTKYLHYCNTALINDTENTHSNNAIVEDLAVICPQVFISERFILLNLGKKILANTDTDTSFLTPYLHLASISLFDEDELPEKISDRYPDLYKMIDGENARKETFYKKNKKTFEFWDNVLFEKKPVDNTLLKDKMLKNEM